MRALRIASGVLCGCALVGVFSVLCFAIYAFFGTHVGEMCGVGLAIVAMALVCLSFLWAIGDAFLDAMGWNRHADTTSQRVKGEEGNE